MKSSASPVLLPGSTIGIFGGGQLGRLTAMAARTMGYRIHVLDPDPGCPARFVVDQCVEAAWDDEHEAARLARGCDVVTLEIEQISLASMNAAGSFCPVRPSEGMLAIIQDQFGGLRRIRALAAYTAAGAAAAVVGPLSAALLYRADCLGLYANA